MMDFLKIFSRVLFVPPAIMLLYDLIYGWFVKNHVTLRSLEQWWKANAPNSVDAAKHVVATITSTPAATKIFNTPAPFVLLVPALFFYGLYRIIFLLQGGKTGGYKSRH